MATFLSLSSEASGFRVLGLRSLVRCTTQSSGHRGSTEAPRTLERLGIRKYSDSSANQDDDKKIKMSFEEYRKMKKSIKTRTRIAGLPMALVGTSLSSAISVYLNPHMFEMTPEEVQPIL